MWCFYLQSSTKLQQLCAMLKETVVDGVPEALWISFTSGRGDLNPENEHILNWRGIALK